MQQQLLSIQQYHPLLIKFLFPQFAGTKEPWKKHSKSGPNCKNHCKLVSDVAVWCNAELSIQKMSQLWSFKKIQSSLKTNSWKLHLKVCKVFDQALQGKRKLPHFSNGIYGNLTTKCKTRQVQTWWNSIKSELNQTGIYVVRLLNILDKDFLKDSILYLAQRKVF